MKVGSQEWVSCSFVFFICHVPLAKIDYGKLRMSVAPSRKTIIGADRKQEEVPSGVRIHHLKNKLSNLELFTVQLKLKGYACSPGR